MSRIFAAALVAAGLTALVFVLVFGRGQRQDPVVPIAPTGDEQEVTGSLLVNGFDIPATAPCNLGDVYAGAGSLTGLPINSFRITSRSEMFMQAQLLCSPQDPSQPVRYANVGLAFLQAIGVPAQPDAPAQPAVRDFLNQAQRTGLSSDFFGHLESRPFSYHGMELQAADRAVFLIDGKNVRLAPVGCWLWSPCATLQQVSVPAPLGDKTIPLMILAIVLLAAGVTLFVTSSTDGFGGNTGTA